MKILILGKGRIAKGVSFYLKEAKLQGDFFEKDSKIENYSILISTLPGKIGEEALGLALKYKKDLIDVADIEESFYLKNKKEIEKQKIRVFPGAGFCPGIVNFILGREIWKIKGKKEVEVKVGSLSPKKFFFPFLWCFEDLVLSHQIPSFQIIEGKRKKFPPFSGYQFEKFYGIEAESYFEESGLENLISMEKFKNFKFRVVRPRGFWYFFKYLQNYGFFKKENFEFTKKILESEKGDNLTFCQIQIFTKEKKVRWVLKSFSKKEEKLNSMQKITSIFPAILAKLVVEGKIKEKGILFLEKLAKKDSLFYEIIKEYKKRILVRRFEE